MNITSGTAGSFRQAGYERAKGDLYETPEWCVDALGIDEHYPAGPIREPHAGRGAMVRAIQKRNVEVVGTELHDWGAFGFPTGVDFLAETDLRGCRSVIMNPPYGKHAEKHIRHALNLIPPEGSVIALLRWNWIAAKGRADLLEKLHDVLILGRVNMPPVGAVDKGHTATTDYAWFTFENWPANSTHIRRFV